MNYAIKLEYTTDDWIYLTKDTGGNCWDLQPELFATKARANDFISKLRLPNATVVKYKKETA